VCCVVACCAGCVLCVVFPLPSHSSFFFLYITFQRNVRTFMILDFKHCFLYPTVTRTLSLSHTYCPTNTHHTTNTQHTLNTHIHHTKAPTYNTHWHTYEHKIAHSLTRSHDTHISSSVRWAPPVFHTARISMQYVRKRHSGIHRYAVLLFVLLLPLSPSPPTVPLSIS
jgi:hypothetical protein